MTAPSMPTGPAPVDPVQAAFDRGLHQLAGLGGDLIGQANRIGTILFSPPRVVIVGRLKAGKSTLVNALIEAPVAETAALEATNVVTVYQDGAPSRADVVGLDGTVATVAAERGQQLTLGRPATEIAYVHRFLPSAAIRDLTLIDTPGLATLTVENEAATRRALIDGFEQTRAASVDADAAVFLFDSTPRSDETAFLRELGFTPLNTLGVLSRADSFGEGVLGRRDPLDHAHEHAGKLAGELRGSVLSVLPVAGLLAETSHTGRFTDHDARLLHQLAGMDSFDLVEVLESEDPASLTPAERDRLLDLAGEYGVLHARDLAARGAYAVNEWLAARSGITALREVLYSTLRTFAAVQRAGRILVELDNLAFSHPQRDRIRDIVHGIRADPAMESVLLFRALRNVLGADPGSPVVGEIERNLQHGSDPARLGLRADAGAEQVHKAATERLVWVQRRQVATRTAAEDDALALLTRTYSRMRAQSMPAPPPSAAWGSKW